MLFLLRAVLGDAFMQSHQLLEVIMTFLQYGWMMGIHW